MEGKGRVELFSRCLYIYIYIYIIYTPNLGCRIALPGPEKDKGRFGGSSEGAQGSTMGQCRGQQVGA